MRKLSIFAVCALVALCGCASNKNTAGLIVRTTGDVAPTDAPNIKQVNSSRLKGKAVITATRKYFDGDMMTAQVSLRSRVTKTLNLQYRFIWFTATGRQVDSGDAWMPFTLLGKDEAYIKATAPDPAIKEFSVDIRLQDK